jgi:ABC-type Na+ efflux pump permease subunit
MNNSKSRRIRNIVTIVLVVFGFLFVVLSIAADDLGIDLTPGFGIIQMIGFLIGLTFLTLGAFLFLHARRPKDAPRSLQAEISTRLMATGLVLAYVTGMSDLIGIGTHVAPSFERPFVGPIQLGGILIGIGLIVFGLVLYYTSRGQRESSSLGFLVTEKKDGPQQ